MTSIKIVYDTDIRRVPLREDGTPFTYNRLVNTLYNLFPVLAGEEFSLTWEDDEGDVVLCCSDEELADAMQVMKARGTLFRFNVKLTKTKAPAAKEPAKPRINFVHTSVTCDECGISPIVGIRYKCAIRHDFDLCEACEAKRIQPYPMIKITDPLQAPQVLVYGLPDGTRNDEGAFWHRGWRGGGGHPHHPPHHHGHPFGGRGGHPHHPPHGPPPFGGEAPPPFGPGPRRGGGRCGWARKFADNLAKEAAPFVAAMDDLFGGFGSETDKNNKPTTTNPPPSQPTATTTTTGEVPSDEIEEQMIEKAIQESLVINEDKPTVVEKADPTPAAAAVLSKYTETVKPANPTLPKPALRFVKDITFTDGTIVQPGAKFRKAWKVRNDGNHSWPEGSALVSVGGDLMGDPNRKEPLPTLAPEAEAELAVQLTAPQAPGMYTAYYRAQTKEQQYFGQRLWASIVVADQEPDWQVVTETTPQKSETASPAPTTPVPVVTVTTPVDPTPVVPEPVAKPEVTNAVPPPTTGTPTANAVVTPVPVEDPQQPPAHLLSAMLLWRRELEVLAEMGFSDPDVVLPLLQQHLGSPISLSGDKNARPNAEGMQQIIATLLSLQN